MAEELAENISNLFSLAKSDGMPLEIRKVALSDPAIGIAGVAVDKISTNFNIEFASRVKLYLTLRILGQRHVAAGQLVILSKLQERNSHLSSPAIDAIIQIGQTLFEKKQFEEAIALMEAAVDFGDHLLGQDFPQKPYIYSNHAAALFRADRFRDAESMRRSELNLWHRSTQLEDLGRRMICEEGLADAIAAQGRVQEAAAIYVRLCEQFRHYEVYMNGPAMTRILQKIQDSMRVT